MTDTALTRAHRLLTEGIAAVRAVAGAGTAQELLSVSRNERRTHLAWWDERAARSGGGGVLS